MNTEVEILGPSSDKADENPLAQNEIVRATVTTSTGRDLTVADETAIATATERALRLKRTQLVTPAVRKDGGLKSQRGSGSIYKTSWTDRRTGLKVESRTWWASYYVPCGRWTEGPRKGKPKRERVRIDTKETDRAKAQRRLNEEMAKAHLPRAGKNPRDVRELEFAAIIEAVERRYREKRHRSLDRVQISLRHLDAHFAGWRIVDIDGAAIERYKDHRAAEGAAPASINRELSALGVGYTLLERKYQIALRPFFEWLEEDNVRTGFITLDELPRLLAHLPDCVAPLIELAFLSGWRIKRELMSRTRDDVIDLGEPTAHLYLDAAHSKNGSARRLYFNDYTRVKEIIEAQIAKADALELKIGKPVTALFFAPNGEPIRNIRRRWKAATIAAGLEGKLMHDLRRSAVKVFNDIGLAREVAKQITGHKSDAVYTRYSINSDDSLKIAAAKLGEHFNKRAAKVVPLKTGTK